MKVLALWLARLRYIILCALLSGSLSIGYCNSKALIISSRKFLLDLSRIFHVTCNLEIANTSQNTFQQLNICYKSLCNNQVDYGNYWVFGAYLVIGLIKDYWLFRKLLTINDDNWLGINVTLSYYTNWGGYNAGKWLNKILI